MATITIEIGRINKSEQRPVSFLVCSGKSKKRIPTEIFLEKGELSPNGKKIRNTHKAQLVERFRRQLVDKLFELSLDLDGVDYDAAYIAQRLTMKPDTIDFFRFTEEWMQTTKTKDLRNYKAMLNALERYLGRRSLDIKDITYNVLFGFERFLNGKPRAQSQYLGIMRHLFREAMRWYNTDYDQVIKNDPFMRYRVPKQIIRKGVRSLSLEQLMAVYHYEGRKGSRAELARDCFILSFCLMGMNSVDMYEVRKFDGNYLKYCRAKTRGRRSDEAYIEVRVHPCVRALIDKYRDKSKARVFNFYKRYADAPAFNSNLNKGLKYVGEACGIEDLEFYQARHTFATLSRNMMRFSKGDVDEALNHVGTLGIADIYIKKDFAIINDNNFKLLDEVFEEK